MSKVPIRIIALLQIIGGLFTMTFLAWTLASQTSALVTEMRGIISGAIMIGELCIDIFAVVSGVTLWRGTSFGRKASIAIQVIQLPKISFPSIIFMFSFGFDLWVYVSSSIVGFQTSFFGSNQIFLMVQNLPVSGFGISVTAIIALVILNKYKPAVRTALGPLPPLPPSEWPASGEGAPNNGLQRTGISEPRIDNLRVDAVLGGPPKPSVHDCTRGIILFSLPVPLPLITGTLFCDRAVVINAPNENTNIRAVEKSLRVDRVKSEELVYDYHMRSVRLQRTRLKLAFHEL